MLFNIFPGSVRVNKIKVYSGNGSTKRVVIYAKDQFFRSYAVPCGTNGIEIRIESSEATTILRVKTEIKNPAFLFNGSGHGRMIIGMIGEETTNLEQELNAEDCVQQ